MTTTEAREQLNITADLLPQGVSNRPGNPLDPKAITIHNTDNDSVGANALAHARYMKGADARTREVSWHFTVDDGRVVQSLPIRERGWHAGPGNEISIGIEICENRGIDQAAANNRAALLTATLSKELGILPDQIYQHNHWTGKDCPHLLRHPSSLWDAFLEKVADYAGQIAGVGGDDCTVNCAAPDLTNSAPLSVSETSIPIPALEVGQIDPTASIQQTDTLEEVYFSDVNHKTQARPVPLYRAAGRNGFFHRGSMAIDVDGSPRAYSPGNSDPRRLDRVDNADGQGGSTTYIQGKMAHGHLGIGPFPGFYVSATSLRYAGDADWDCGKYLDAEEVPFFIYPGGRNGVRLGDVGIVVHIATLKWTPAIVGDEGKYPRVSECSLRVAINLEKSFVDPATLRVHGLSASNGDDRRNYFYLYFPGSAFTPEPISPHWPEERIRAAATSLFEAWGGIPMVQACLAVM